MDLIALAVPLFLLALFIELLIDWRRGTGFYRSNDAINSLSAGIMSTTFGYFTKFLSLIVWAYVFANFSLLDMQTSWFDLSATGLALWAIAALAWDFCYYWQHRCYHEYSILWAAHAVHHQSEDYNLSTALRQSSTSFLFSWIFYLPLFVIGFPLEVLLTVGAINLLYQFWVHTQFVSRLGVLDRILVTPSNHRVHHAQNERYIDKNYGGILILWDRCFGTFVAESNDDPVVFGIRKPLRNWNPFWANLQVYDYLLFDSLHTQRWRDKIGLWFSRTGWRPADVEARYPKQHAALSGFRKFDPPVSSGRRYYILAQFAVAVAGAMFIAAMFARDGAASVLVPCLLLWAQLYTLGSLGESRPQALLMENLRLLVVLPLGFLLLQTVGAPIQFAATGWITLIIYILASVLWLRRN